MALCVSMRRICCHLTRNVHELSHTSNLTKRITCYQRSASNIAKSKGQDSGPTTKMKRAAAAATGSPTSKKRRVEIPEYHTTPSRRTELGEIIWPAPEAQIQAARDFILECVAAGVKTLIVPDKDADGLTSGVILQKTLILLGLDANLISAHLLQKGHNVHDESERTAMAAHEPAYIFVLDQGSRKSPPVIDKPHKALVIDHHHALDDEFPEGCTHVTACNSPPVATSALLTYLICRALHADVEQQCDWLCAMGTHGDLGNTLKWEPPLPDMRATFKRHTKKAIHAAVALVNAPRRTAAYNVPAAWAALVVAAAAAADASGGPAALLRNEDLLAAREAVAAEVARCGRAAPRFSADGAFAVLRIRSAAQVHPVVATRWAGGHLRSAQLKVVLVANDGYLPGMVNFSCRVARCAREGRDGGPVDIIGMLRGIAARGADDTLPARLGESFARGHKEASGGIVPVREFEELMDIMGVGKRDEGAPVVAAKKKPAPDAGNTITNYFGKKA